MNLASLLALLAITLTDPTGDAIGDGTLDPPTSPIYANVAMFDLQTVQLEVSDTGEGVLTVTLGALGSLVPKGLPEGADEDGAEAEEVAGSEAEVADPADGAVEDAAEFDISALLAVVDVYLDTGVGGADQTLSGPNMLMPAGAGWHHAVRISAEGAWGITYVGAALPEQPGAAGSAPADVDPTEPLQSDQDASGGDPLGLETPLDSETGEPQTLAYVPLAVSRAGNALSMTLPWTFEPEAPVDVYAVTGVHDPFSPDGWRGVSQTSSPWAFSGGQQVVPVIDLLAPDAEAQAAALRSGILPASEHARGMTLPLSPWLWLMVAGLALALFGLVLRGRVGAPATKEAAGGGETAGADPTGAEDGAAASGDYEVGDDHVSTAVDETEPEGDPEVDPENEHAAGPAEPVAYEWDQVELVTGTDPGTAMDVEVGKEPDTEPDTDPDAAAGTAPDFVGNGNGNGNGDGDGDGDGDVDVGVDVAGTLLAFDADDYEAELGADQAAADANGQHDLDGAANGAVTYPEEGAGNIRAPADAFMPVDSGPDDEEAPALVVPDEPDVRAEGADAANRAEGTQRADGTGNTDVWRTSTDRSAFSTAVDETYLNFDGEGGGGVFGDDVAGGESFWHPGSRLKNSSTSLRNVAEELGAGTGTRDEGASGGQGNAAHGDEADHARDDEEA